MSKNNVSTVCPNCGSPDCPSLGFGGVVLVTPRIVALVTPVGALVMRRSQPEVTYTGHLAYLNKLPISAAEKAAIAAATPAPRKQPVQVQSVSAPAPVPPRQIRKVYERPSRPLTEIEIRRLRRKSVHVRTQLPAITLTKDEADAEREDALANGAIHRLNGELHHEDRPRRVRPRSTKTLAEIAWAEVYG